MKKAFLFVAALLMVCTMANAQAYVNVELKDGTIRSYSEESTSKVTFGEKKGLEPTEFSQTVIVNGHTVAVKLADDTPANEVMLSIYVEEEKVKIEAYTKLNHGLWCSMDGNSEVPVTSVSNGFYTFTLSTISKDVAVTLGYINVSFDINNSGMDAKFTDKPHAITKIGYNDNAYIKEPDRPFSDKYGFRGWYKDKECTKAWDFSTDKVTKSITLYAKWAKDPTGNKINGYEYVKLGGYYWATVNVYKATDVETKFDGYENYGSYYTQTEDNALNAAKSWGSEGNYSWTLPSAAQWQALIDYCKWEWYTNYKGMNGYLVTGRDDTFESGNSVFLPAAGYCSGSKNNVYDQGSFGHYWSADGGGTLIFRKGSRLVDYYDPYEGKVVRPVLE